MPDENLDNLDSLDSDNQSGENQNNNQTQPDKLDPEIQKRDAQIAHWRDKATKLETENKTLKEQPKPNDNVSTGVNPLEAVKLGKALQGYDEGETDFILRNAKSAKPEDIIKAASDEWVQDAIKSRREKVARENKVPSPSSPSGGSSEKSAEDIAKMSREEHMAYEKELQERQRGSQGV